MFSRQVKRAIARRQAKGEIKQAKPAIKRGPKSPHSKIMPNGQRYHFTKGWRNA